MKIDTKTEALPIDTLATIKALNHCVGQEVHYIVFQDVMAWKGGDRMKCGESLERVKQLFPLAFDWVIDAAPGRTARVRIAVRKKIAGFE